MKYKVFKNYLLIIITGVIVFAAINFAGCYTYDAYTSGDWGIIKIVPGATYAVHSYYWDGTQEGTVLTIPEEYDGHKITDIGAETLSCPFGVDFPDELDGAIFYSLSSDGKEILRTESVTFTIILSKNISVLDSCLSYSQNYETESGALIVYEIYFYFECSDENQTFYADGGVLYNKNDNTLAEWGSTAPRQV